MLISLREVRVAWHLARTRVGRILLTPDRFIRRRRSHSLRAVARPSSTYAMSISDLARDGFSPCSLGNLGTSLLDSWQGLEELRSNQASSRHVPRTTGKAFFEEVLTDDDLQTFPALLAVAIDEGVLTTIVDAMGMVPRLESVDILLSSPSDAQPAASQLWHHDVNDERIIKLFVYLEDCGPENGPFTYIPAPPSRRVSRATRHYVDDATIAAHVPPSDWCTVEGPAGTAFFIDTGRCYHFGSRCKKRRVAYIATYSSGIGYMRRTRLWRDILQADALSPLQRAVCGLPR